MSCMDMAIGVTWLEELITESQVQDAGWGYLLVFLVLLGAVLARTNDSTGCCYTAVSLSRPRA